MNFGNYHTNAVALLSMALLILAPNANATKSKKIEQSFKVDAGQRIEINGFSGSHLQFRSWEKPEVFVSITVSITASDENFEKSFIEEVKIKESRSAGVVAITFDDASKMMEQSSSFWQGLKSLVGGARSISREVKGEIFVPSTNDLSANIPYANVSLENMKGLINLTGTSNELALRNCSALQNVSNDYGKTTIQNSGGSLTLKGQSGTITVEDFNGDVRCEAPYAKLRFSRIAKPLSIKSQSGDLRVDDVRGNLSVESDYTPMTITNIAGFADIKTQSGTVKIRQVDGVSVNANYSNIEINTVSGKSNKDIIVNSQSGALVVEDVVGNLRIDNPYSRIQLKNVKGNVRITTQSGTVNADGVAGDWDSETQYSSIRVKGLSAKNIRADNSSNPIAFELTTVPSLIDIHNQYAHVAVTMPKGFGGDVNLDVEYGTIETNFPLTTKNKSGSGYAIGKVGSGTGSIKIETTSGNISLREK